MLFWWQLVCVYSADGMTDQPMSDLQITRVLSCQSTNQTSLFVEDDIIAALLALRLQLLKLMTFTFNPLFNVKALYNILS